MTVNRSALTNQTKFRSILKDACYVAGLQGRPIIVYIPEGLNKEGMQDVAAMLIEGKQIFCSMTQFFNGLPKKRSL